MLRRTRKPVILVVNKVDTPNLPDDFYDFYELGIGGPMPISSANMLGIGDVLEEIVKLFPEGSDT
ncbi:ribosome biogenesis GTPase Der, partial [Acinetobacter baumannii]|nr:ribosome biogenesis GTPase Der [Acinetobacter baumannii]